tara:strand:+ start:3852 stop:4109 length:258 start_codon:yes stop_codon:yes gene_type:complete
MYAIGYIWIQSKMNEYSIPVSTTWSTSIISEFNFDQYAVDFDDSEALFDILDSSEPLVDTFHFDQYAVNFDSSEEWFNGTGWTEV